MRATYDYVVAIMFNILSVCMYGQWCIRCADAIHAAAKCCACLSLAICCHAAQPSFPMLHNNSALLCMHLIPIHIASFNYAMCVGFTTRCSPHAALCMIPCASIVYIVYVSFVCVYLCTLLSLSHCPEHVVGLL